MDKKKQNVMTKWSRKCSCLRIHSLPSSQMALDVTTAPVNPLRIEECEANCFQSYSYRRQWKPIACRRRRFGRFSSVLGGKLQDVNMPSLISNRQIENAEDYVGSYKRNWPGFDDLRRTFQIIPSFRGRPSRFQCLQLLFVFALLLLIILALKMNLLWRGSRRESPSMIDVYRSEIESLKHAFPGQSGWLWLILDTLALDLIGQPAYNTDDQMRSVIFGVPHDAGLSGSFLAWEVTKAINKVSSHQIHQTVNFSFADIHCLYDCCRYKTGDGVARPDLGGRMTDVGSVLWEEYSVEERLSHLMAEVSKSGLTAVLINHLQAAPRAGLDLLIRPRHKSKPPGSLRMILHTVHLPQTGKSRTWTVSKVRNYIVSLWQNLDPEIELLLKTRLIGNVVLVRPPPV